VLDEVRRVLSEEAWRLFTKTVLQDCGIEQFAGHMIKSGEVVLAHARFSWRMSGDECFSWLALSSLLTDNSRAGEILHTQLREISLSWRPSLRNCQ
jgi:hypothetical protein